MRISIGKYAPALTVGRIAGEFALGTRESPTACNFALRQSLSTSIVIDES